MKFKEIVSSIKKNKFGVLLFLVILGSVIFYVNYLKENQLFPEATLYFIDDITLPTAGKKVLVFSPHPDDETIAAGGLIYESLKNKADVKIVLVTDGNKHNLKNKRYSEFKKATNILGVESNNLVFFNLKDGRLKSENREKLRKLFENEIKNFSPDFVVYPYPRDKHPDHSITGEIIENILKEYPRILGYSYIVHIRNFPYPQKFKPDDYILPPVFLVNLNHNWQRLILSQDARDKKLEAVLQYKTQLRYLPLRNFLYSFIRKNEIFCVLENKN